MATRNKRLAQEIERVAREAVAKPQHELSVAISGKLPKEERQARAVAGWARECSYWCDHCKAEFDDGDVVYRRRVQGDPNPWGASWNLEAICDKCVRGDMHPTWREYRREPVPCAGGCGVLVSHWYDYAPVRTCSRRCSERAEAERRRVKHEDRRCDVCKDAFTPKRADARYCSNACRQDAYRKRKVGAE